MTIGSMLLFGYGVVAGTVKVTWDKTPTFLFLSFSYLNATPASPRSKAESVPERV
jgi:hypothetical protein